ncbi:prolyl oligopeptidase family serine peptidase [Corynebacterium epidermidicanis]|uniref:Serine protease, S9A family peptidase n=1 Tax=Corynebacterium epidermidicanis TaxID=1050174 RepID=A0A0G3GU49_9CORY|nr:prolyl oligopeptidase family serine peptidase [Corynebacterium epidermidicanis]AKK04080.1 serine protease, S9A family peptidase [Corynebacterium epidermidicanis]
MFLEGIDGEEALAWAKERSQRCVDKLDPATLSALTTRLQDGLDTDARIPMPRRRGERLFNFWRDAAHPRGVWRTCTFSEYSSDTPDWQVLIDLDELAETEQENWVWKGAHVRSPEYDRALIRLSRGGADATVIREFDLGTGQFVRDGFHIPEAKTDVSWVDIDTLLVGTDMGADTLTDSGYPAHVYRWRRGTNLGEATLEFSGERSDVAVGGWHDTMPGYERTFYHRSIDFYRSDTFLATPTGPVRLDVPEDCSVSIFRQWIFLNPRTSCFDIPAGGLGCQLFDAFLSGDRNFHQVFTPTARTSLQGLNFTHNYLVLTVLDNVTTRISYAPIDTPWAPQRPLKDIGASTARVAGTSPLRDDEIWLTYETFTEPTQLLHGQVGGDITPIKTAPELFDARGIETRQHWATSSDGTAIPYFITGRFPEEGELARPTLVHAYGGFEVSLLPGYYATRGISWLEAGNYFVEANLRGGGEFGPDWHAQVVKTNRYKVWEDHRAVLEDLTQRGYTTREQLGIRGGSNGGLLTAGALVQYPELFGAAVIQVPLTDMLRYHTMSAGASWMAEYGNPDDPQERAAIMTWSPLHNVDKQRTYPPALVTTSTRDDRVHPAHARLFAAALEDALQPVDYFENTEGGHAGAANNAQVAKMEALIYTWLGQQLQASTLSNR